MEGRVLRKRSRPYYKEPSLDNIYIVDFKQAKCVEEQSSLPGDTAEVGC